jgi:DHA2 family multidrug resistance protein
VPLRYLQEVQGYRPLQSNLITLEIAAAQLVMLPAMALLLDYKRSIRASSAWSDWD